MWNVLNELHKKRYQKLITNFASLSEAFSQKSENEEGTSSMDKVAPIVNSKFQETAFQRCFGATAEDIANTSYDASLRIDDNHRYLIGIKSFGIHSGDQKVAQFKAASVNGGWSYRLAEARKNAEVSESKSEADQKNEGVYLEIAQKISELRNERIASSKAQIRGFNHAEDIAVEAVYHVLMPSKKGESPKIFVGETDYRPIDIANIKIIGATSKDRAANFKFSDTHHIYKYTDADSQLYMSFFNKDIVVDEWDVAYVDDAFSFFENLGRETIEAEAFITSINDDQELPTSLIAEKKVDYEASKRESYSWMIENSKGEVEQNSGFNGFAGGSKLARKGGAREQRIERFKLKYRSAVSESDMNYLINMLKEILLPSYSTEEERNHMKNLRNQLRIKVEMIGNLELQSEILGMVYRPENEMYIPIPDAKNFHEHHPNFFGPQIGTFKNNSNKLALPKEERKFTLEFYPSGNRVEAYINQDNGKSIQSTKEQGILGEWILREIFRLEKYKPLTAYRLDELGINGIRLTKIDDNEDERIRLEFIWIDVENPPKDAIGWVAKFEK